MKVRLSMILIAVVLALGFPMASYAGMMPHAYKGQVTSYDQTGHMIVVHGKDGVKTFDLSNATVTGTIGPNKTVRVRYTENNGRMIASSVRVIKPRVSWNSTEAGDPDTTNGYGVQANPGN